MSNYEKVMAGLPGPKSGPDFLDQVFIGGENALSREGVVLPRGQVGGFFTTEQQEYLLREIPGARRALRYSSGVVVRVPNDGEGRKFELGGRLILAQDDEGKVVFLNHMEKIVEEIRVDTDVVVVKTYKYCGGKNVELTGAEVEFRTSPISTTKVWILKKTAKGLTRLGVSSGGDSWCEVKRGGGEVDSYIRRDSGKPMILHGHPLSQSERLTQAVELWEQHEAAATAFTL